MAYIKRCKKCRTKKQTVVRLDNAKVEYCPKCEPIQVFYDPTK